MTYTFDQVREAIRECTAYDLRIRVVDDSDENGYALIDPYGDVDGDLFYDLDDVVEYITNNDQVADYLSDLVTDNS